MKKSLLCVAVAATLFSCGNNDKKKEVVKEKEKEEVVNEYEAVDAQARQLFGALKGVAENTANPLTAEKIALGKALYFEKKLSKDNTQSCNTCHDLKTYGVDNQAFSMGNDGKLGGRNSPTTFNAAFHVAQFWDGREPDVEAQAGGPILNPVEMAMHSKEAVIERLSEIDSYKEMFAKAFPESKEAITYDNVKKALGAFERKLVTPSRFDDYIAGDDHALTDKEKKGLQTYMESGCISCHSGTLLGGNMYQKFGLFDDYWKHTKSEKVDLGKFEVTKEEADKYVFKVPSLRNIEKTGPYFHDGSVKSLTEAVKIMAKVQANKDLTETQTEEIIAFLNTLTGELPADVRE
ncbi:cytochrome-c peroxidase [Aureivirga marina]|uniref:cytochrome-c peroxidase n=1 Tax=Aureivirga marina TaxID=1182451 RepID=UPI0018C943E2|nr:cytochrome-c peroxidase [Aureivirga marina]